MKKFSIQIKVGFLLLIAVMLVSATVIVSYRNLSSIVTSLQIDLNPEMRLVTIREISYDLESADNSIRLYTITGDTSDLYSYYSVVSNIDEKVNTLQAACSGDSIMLNQIDTISNLIEENIVIWNELLYLLDNDNVVRYLKRLSDQVITASAVNEKKGILKRVFARNTRNILSGQEIIDSIQKIEKEERITREKIRVSEEQLALTSNRIKEALYDLIARMENQVSLVVREKAKAAHELAQETYLWLAIFSGSGGLLVLLVLVIIVRYIRKTHAYQIALEKSKFETESLSRTKELFMANMSHEIRTPVTAISGFTEQLLHETADENILESVRIIKSSSDHLAKIIDDILDMSKLQSGKLVLEKVHFSIDQVLNEVLILFKQQAENKNISLDYIIKAGTPPALFGDPYRMKQILINLVGNAVKFTEQGFVNYSVEGIADDSGSVDLVLEVADTGIGIDESMLKNIFEDFVQAEINTTRKFGGTGLGLSIVKKLVELHDGSIVCESKKNQGTKITCHLMFRAGKADQVHHDISLPPSIPGEIAGLKVLVADDEEYNRLLFRKIFQRWQVQCDEVASGLDAIEILKEKRYDILFMDIRMPGIDGIKAARFIRNELKIPEHIMQIIFISAASLNHEWKKYSSGGINAFILKPFNEEILLATMLAVRKGTPRGMFNKSEKAEIVEPSGDVKVDLNNLYHISGGDSQFVKQMLIAFNFTTDKGLSEIQEAASSGEWERVSGLAHKLLPPCRHLGARNLFNLLKEIEDGVSKNRDPQYLDNLTKQSIKEFRSISETLTRHIGDLK